MFQLLRSYPIVAHCLHFGQFSSAAKRRELQMDFIIGTSYLAFGTWSMWLAGKASGSFRLFGWDRHGCCECCIGTIYVTVGVAQLIGAH
jgi:hypothetical protein